MRRWRDERGMVGKLAVIWLLFLAMVVVAAVDSASIVYTRIHLSNIATAAASDTAVAYRLDHDAAKACAAAQLTIEIADPKIKLGKDFCQIDPTTDTVTISLHQEARTILAERLGPTQKYASVVDRETSGRSSV